MHGNNDRRDYNSSSVSGRNMNGRGGSYHRRGAGRWGQRGRGGDGNGRHNNNNNNRHPHSTTTTTQRQMGNRFQDRQSYLDPQQQVLQDLLQMVAKVGIITAPPAPAESSSASFDEKDTTNEVKQTKDHSLQQQQQQQLNQPQRVVVQQQVQNVQLLTGVVCGSNSKLFLQKDSTQTQARTHYGPMVVQLIHCVGCMTLQTNLYASFVLLLHETIQQQEESESVSATTTTTTTISQSVLSSSTLIASFLDRTISYTIKILTRDLDKMMLFTTLHPLMMGSEMDWMEQGISMTHCRLQLRFLAMLQNMQILESFQEDMEVPNYANVDDNDTNTTIKIKSVWQLLQYFVKAAYMVHQKSSNRRIATIFATLVLSTVPYLSHPIWTLQNLVQPLDDLLKVMYRSTYTPGSGCDAILLKDEPMEPSIGLNKGNNEEDEEIEEDEEEDDDEDNASGQVCDSLQDLLRTTKQYLQKQSSRFALLTDAPWKIMNAPTVVSDSTMEENVDGLDKKSLQYSGQPLALEVFDSCKSLSTILASHNNNTDNTATTATLSTRNDLTGVVYGRLPLFGPPPDVELEEDDDEEEEEMDQGESKITNDRLLAYMKDFGLVDRYFVGEVVRDMCLCYQPSVSATGVERGTIKTVAEQIWSMQYMTEAAHGDLANPAKGLEYAILEHILSCIAQCSHGSVFSVIYLSRVLLELTKLEPTIFSPAIVISVSTLFQDFMPSLTPMARHNLSQWFAFHLIHTDYQWPSAYWKHWELFVQHGWNSSRGDFVKTTISILVENVSDPGILVRNCLPKDSVLVQHLLENPIDSTMEQSTDEGMNALSEDIKIRIQRKDDPATILQYLSSDEVTESNTVAVQSMSRKDWWRTCIVVRALINPAIVYYQQLRTDLDKVLEESGDNAMDTISDHKDDVLSQILDSLKEYQPLLLGIMEIEGETPGDSGRDRVVLEEMHMALFYSRTLFTTCIQALVRDGTVSAINVLKWLLGDINSNIDNDKANIFLRWWDVTTSLIQHGMIIAAAAAASSENIISSTTTAMEEDTVDGVKNMKNTGVNQKTKVILEYLEPLLTYIVTRVGTVLAMIHDETKGNKLMLEHVNLVEGCKHVVVTSRSDFVFTMRHVSSSNESYNVWCESVIAGPKLAALLDIGVSPAVEMLRASLERM